MTSTNDNLNITLLDMNNRLNKIVDKLQRIMPQDFVVYTEQLESITSKIKEGFVTDTYFVCSGEFSAGKSTFINAVLSEDLLPTADRPCTSIITEIRFVDRGGKRAKIVYLDGQHEDLSYEDYKILADGATKKIGTIATVHHVELYYDVQDMEEDYPLLTTLKNLNIILVDTPGFGSPYPINEDVIAEYIDVAAFGFWFFPVDRFGGMTCKSVLRKLNSEGKKVRVIPVLTKSDLLRSEQEKDEVSENFRNTLGDYFADNEPLFISALKFKESTQKRNLAFKTNNEDKKEEYITEAEKLEVESGIEHIAMKISTKTQSKVFTTIKVDEIIKLVEDFIGIAEQPLYKVQNTNNKKLTELGWKPDNDYARLDVIKKELERWAIVEAKDLAETFQNSLIEAIQGTVNSRSNNAKVQRVFGDVLQSETGKLQEIIKEKDIPHIVSKLKIEELLNSPKLDMSKGKQFALPKDVLIEKVNVIMHALQEAGPKAITQAGLGAIVVASIPLVKTVTLVGGALATLAPIVGGALMVVAACTIIPALNEQNKQSKEKAAKHIKHSIESWISTTKFNVFLTNILQELIEEGYKLAKTDVAPHLQQYVSANVTIASIDDDIKDIKDKIKNVLPLYTTKKRGR